ncbi:Protein Daple [Neolecta irregularis DAH-3]|uniref:Protein Daple n=1 Tax=Neolecta irregularis (strain DAH-3) TaxID=1198029 RepID=A0A1U7LMN4_NEOID|nr:Protein Daple [Neolecta irregularis DAH-3]|eukprot:OLL23907.1 Protein Daple [Neolecta irregularis DAH-3]
MAPVIRPPILPSMTPPEESTDIEQIAELKARILDKDREMRQLEQDKLEQRDALEDMERQVSMLQGFLEKKSPPRQSLLPIEDVEEDVDNLRNLIKERDDKIKSMREENEKRRAEFRATLDQIEKTSEEANRIYEAKIQELELFIKEKQQELSILHLNLDTLTDRRHNHDEQIEESTEEMAGQLKVLEGVVSEMEGYLIQSRERINELENEVDALHQELSQSQSRVRVLEDQIRSRPSSSESHPQKRQMITFLEREVDRLKSENEALRNATIEESTDTEQIAGLKHIVSELTRHNVETETQNQKLKKELKRISASPDDTLVLKRKLESMEKDKQRLSKELTELEAMVESKVFREEELEREVAKLRRESSRSNDRQKILSSPIEEELW